MGRLQADLVERIVERESRKFRWKKTSPLMMNFLKTSRPDLPKPPRDALREKLIADQQNLINYWVKSVEERKASLLADLKGGEFQLGEGSTFMIDWDKLISPIKEAASLDDAYQAFLTFHYVVDESLAVVGDFHEIWEEFVVSNEKQLVEKRLKSERKNRRKLPYGTSYTCSEYWVKERQHRG